jgi:hypothetical protein
MKTRRPEPRSRSSLAAILVSSLAAIALAQGDAQRPPLVPCVDGPNVPCVVVATSPSDIAGVWKQYLGNPMFQAPEGMAFVRYSPDGSVVLAPTVEDTAAPFDGYPRGSIDFEGSVATMRVEGAVAPECVEARFEIRVIRLGSEPVALAFTIIEDECGMRRMDVALPLIWVAP